MMSRGAVIQMSNVKYRFSDDGITGYGILEDGTEFIFDAALFEKIRYQKWYACYKNIPGKQTYIINKNGLLLHQALFGKRENMELDHINLNTLDNRSINVRFCTHQQNQMNQPLQKNNTSGVAGVRFYKARNKFIARIKVCQHDIHLGYFLTFEEAVQARNVGMECMFGEYGRYNDVSPTPLWIKQKVIQKCMRFAHLSVNENFKNQYLSIGA